MFRQALAESQAWTPMPSPWTLPTGLASPAALGRPLSRSTSWLAASDIASPIGVGRDALGQGGGHGVGGLLRRGGEDGLAHLVHPGVLRRLGAEGRPTSLYWSSSFGSTTRAAGRVRWLLPPPPNAFRTQ